MLQIAPSRDRVATLLTILLLFFGVAVFSELHRHESGVCSINDLEHQLIPLACAAAVLAPSTVSVASEIPQKIQSPAIGHAFSARGRAPPSLP